MIDVLIFVVSTVFVLSIVVTIHELGHYWAARACGVAIDCFSLGFGPALASWRDKSGVEWRLAAIPLGGYVRFSGDENAASVPDQNDLAAMKRAIVEREGEAAVGRYFHFKPIWQRAVIAAAGPIANFVLAIAIFTVLFAAYGQVTNPARIDRVLPGGAAEAAGFQSGDLIVSADSKRIRSFQDLQQYTTLRANVPIRFGVERGSQSLELTATPRLVERTDKISGRVKVGALGLESRSRPTLVKPSIIEAVPAACDAVWDMLKTIAYYLGRLVRGQVPADQISGLIGIGHTAGAVAKAGAAGAPDLPSKLYGGLVGLTVLIGSLSVSIGFMNLLPIPVLDGGHLLMYAYEAIAKRPLRADFQAAGFRAGLALILGFMLFAAWNDLNRYDVFKFIGGLFT
jgi:regulator of sigma E protease